MSTFVSLGTSRDPFRRLLDKVEELAARSRIPLPVTIQSGHTPFKSRACEVVPFLAMDEFEKAIGGASLVICQAGGGTVIQARLHGRIPVVVPRLPELGEVVDSHQVANARALDIAGNAVAVFEIADLEAGVRRALALQAEQESRREESKLVGAIRCDLEAWDRLA